MNDVPPSQEPSDDDIDTLYRRASALDTSRPSTGVSRAILAHAALVSAERTLQRDPASTNATRARTRRTWWRPAVFGTLAAAVLAGLFVLPNIRTSYLAPKTYSPAVRQEAVSAAPEPSQNSERSAPAIAPTSPAEEPSSAPASSIAAASPDASTSSAPVAPLRAQPPSTATVDSPTSSTPATEARAQSFAPATPSQPSVAVPTAPPARLARSAAAPPRTPVPPAASPRAPFAGTAAPSPAPAPASPAPRDKQSPTEAIASGAAGQLAEAVEAVKAAPKAKARRKSSAAEPATNGQQIAAADAKDQTTLAEVTVAGQRITRQDTYSTPSAITSIAAESVQGGLTSVAPPVILFSSPARLHLAAERGDLETLQAALDQQTDINSRDEAGRTALLLATLHNKSKAVTLLLAHGADPNIADASGLTPLQAATKSRKSAIIDALKGAGAH